MRYRSMNGEDISQLAFGCMRLPLSGSRQSDVDIDKVEELVLAAVDGGVNYFDSAYFYHDGASEKALGEVLLRNNIRDRVNIATKFPTFGRFADGDFEDGLNEQLSRLKTDRIDFYLVHGLRKETWLHIRERGLPDFMEKLKSDGVIRYFGFSFHDVNENYEYILNDYDWDFSQIQFNFMDTEYQAGLAGLQLAASKNVPVMIMEPLKGGLLARETDPQIVQLKEKHGLLSQSLASIALSFIYDFPGVTTVLSGMNAMEQLNDNLQTASSASPLSFDETGRAFLADLKNYYESKATINCTSCRYCMQECPQEVSIPRIFSAYNNAVRYNAPERGRNDLSRFETVWDCVECGQCMEACPQHLAIPELIAAAKAYFSIV